MILIVLEVFNEIQREKNKCMLPKLSKGPDIFISIAIDLKKNMKIY